MPVEEGAVDIVVAVVAAHTVADAVAAVQVVLQRHSVRPTGPMVTADQKDCVVVAVEVLVVVVVEEIQILLVVDAAAVVVEEAVVAAGSVVAAVKVAATVA